MVDGAGAGATLDVGVAIGVGVVVSLSNTPPPTPAAKAIASAPPAIAIVVLARNDIEPSLVAMVILDMLIMSPIAHGDRVFRLLFFTSRDRKRSRAYQRYRPAGRPMPTPDSFPTTDWHSAFHQLPWAAKPGDALFCNTCSQRHEGHCGDRRMCGASS